MKKKHNYIKKEKMNIILKQQTKESVRYKILFYIRYKIKNFFGTNKKIKISLNIDIFKF